MPKDVDPNQVNHESFYDPFGKTGHQSFKKFRVPVGAVSKGKSTPREPAPQTF